MRRSISAVAVVLFTYVAACDTDRSTAPPARSVRAGVRTAVAIRHSPDYMEESRHAVFGVPITDGCRFTGRDSMRAGERASEWAVEYDPTNCRLTLAKGQYVGPSRMPRGESRSFRDSIGSAEKLMQAGAHFRRPFRGDLPTTLNDDITCDNQLDSHFTAYQHLWVEDPIFLDVSVDELWLDYYSRPQLLCVQTAAYTHIIHWLVTTGSYEADFHTNSFTLAADRSYVEASVRSLMANLLFCDPSALTLTGYSPNKIRAFPDGWAIFEWDYSITGDCAFLLGFHRDRWVQGS